MTIPMTPRRSLRALALVALLAHPLAAQLPGWPPFVEARVPKAPTVASGSAGDFLVYELHVTSLEAREIKWTRVEVANADGGAVLQTVADSALWRDLARPAQGTIAFLDRPRLRGSQRAVAYLHVPLAAGVRPRALVHRLVFADSAGERTLTMAPVPVTPRAIAISPPLRGTNWFAANGPGNASGHRRTIIPLEGAPRIAQRFAIDWVQVDSTFKTYKGDPKKNESYYAEGQDALAVADGIVVATKDGIPENVPGADSRAVPITLETVGGNHVIIDLGQGAYAFYAHLRPGSLRVKVGDKVKRGQVVGSVGNSGNSTEPHLHFHIGDGTAPLASEGIPYTLSQLEVVGTCKAFGVACAFRAPATFTNVVPLENEVVRFVK